jgi:hypothetical protein
MKVASKMGTSPTNRWSASSNRTLRCSGDITPGSPRRALLGHPSSPSPDPGTRLRRHAPPDLSRAYLPERLENTEYDTNAHEQGTLSATQSSSDEAGCANRGTPDQNGPVEDPDVAGYRHRREERDESEVEEEEIDHRANGVAGTDVGSAPAWPESPGGSVPPPRSQPALRRLR